MQAIPAAGDGLDFQGIVQTACLARLDVEQIAGAHCRQPRGIVRIDQRFVGHDGDGTGSMHTGEGIEIPV